MPTTPTETPVSDLDDVRQLVADALTQYADSPEGRGRIAAGLSGHDLAENVRGWTHTTRLRDYVAGHPRNASPA